MYVLHVKASNADGLVERGLDLCFSRQQPEGGYRYLLLRLFVVSADSVLR